MTTKTGPAKRQRLLLALAAGIAAFAVGAALALTFLPEWRGGAPRCSVEACPPLRAAAR